MLAIAPAIHAPTSKNDVLLEDISHINLNELVETETSSALSLEYSFTNSIQSEKKPMAKFAFPPEVSVLNNSHILETELDITEQLNDDPNVKSNGRASYALAKGEYIETELDITEPLNEDPNVESNRRASEALATNSHSDSKHDFSHASLPADQNVAKNTRY